MKKNALFILTGAFLSLASCTKERINGNGPTITETRTISNFTAVAAAGSSNVYITQGAVFKVEVKGYSNLLPFYETKLENGTLKLGYSRNVNIGHDNTEVFITMPVLNGLKTAGSGNISTTGNFNSLTNFTISISGSGNIHFSEGTTQSFYSSIEGSGNIYAFGMIAERAEINTQGSGNTEITASNELKGKIAGSGNIYYKGSPVVTADISGSGTIMPR